MKFLNVIRKAINRVWKFISTPTQYAKRCGVKMGKGCVINTKHFPTEPYLIEFGNYVRVAMHTKFFTHGGLVAQRFNHPELILEQYGRIKVGDYSYIGDSCLIMPGVEIGSNCIVGAGSVVTKSIPDGMMVAGNPAKIIGKTEDMIQRVAAKCPIKSRDFYKLNQRERKEFILNIPDDLLIHKKMMSV
jgi:acetyltransferase-like isoleucine patch superfamily enzyme